MSEPDEVVPIGMYADALWYRQNLNILIKDQMGRYPNCALVATAVPAGTLNAMDAADLAAGWSTAVVAKARQARSIPKYITVGPAGIAISPTPDLARASGRKDMCAWHYTMLDRSTVNGLSIMLPTSGYTMPPADHVAAGTRIASILGLKPLSYARLSFAGSRMDGAASQLFASTDWLNCVSGTSEFTTVWVPYGGHITGSAGNTTTWCDFVALRFSKDDPQVAGLRTAYIGAMDYGQRVGTSGDGFFLRPRVVYLEPASLGILAGRPNSEVNTNAANVLPNPSNVLHFRSVNSSGSQVVEHPLPALLDNALRVSGGGSYGRFGVSVYKGLVVGGPSFVHSFGYQGSFAVSPKYGGHEIVVGAGLRDMEWLGSTLYALSASDTEVQDAVTAENGGDNTELLGTSIRSTFLHKKFRAEADPLSKTQTYAEITAAGGDRGDIENEVLFPSIVHSDGSATDSTTFGAASAKVARKEYDTLHIMDKIFSVGVSGYGFTIELKGTLASYTATLKNASDVVVTVTEPDDLLSYYWSGAVLSWVDTTNAAPASLVDALKAYTQSGDISLEGLDEVADGMQSEFNELSVYKLWANPEQVLPSEKSAQEMIHLLRPRDDLNVVSVAAITSGRICAKKFGIHTM